MSNQFKCHLCADCDGYGCVNEMPGMGGVHNNENCVQNRAAWSRYHIDADFPMDSECLPRIRLAPITGAVQNVGYGDERGFYRDLIASARRAGVGLSIGDGYPDEKLKYGIEALKSQNARGAVFLKPYANEKILERLKWVGDVAEIVGIDIDAWQIPTMRGLVDLYRKSAAELRAIRRRLDVPFALKGVFLRDDVDLVAELRPDIVIVSNHGGRVPTRSGSTADFLARWGLDLAMNSSQVWVDGGIRDLRDLAAARSLGATEVLIGRPFIQGLARDGENGVSLRLREMLSPAPFTHVALPELVVA